VERQANSLPGHPRGSPRLGLAGGGGSASAACIYRKRRYVVSVALRGFRYRFYPTAEQESLLRRTMGCVRLVYNKALAERSEAWTHAKKSIRYATQDRSLTAWKKDPALTFLNEVSSVPLQQTLRHLQTAYGNFFQKRAKYPSFKRKHAGGSAAFTKSGFRFRDGALTLAKMAEPLDVRWSRPLPNGVDPTTVTVSLDAAGRWHVSLLCEDASINPLPKLKTAVGIDLGISALATLSTGEKIANPRHSDSERTRKTKLSRSLSRKKKGSKNRLKARAKFARLHARIADRRRDTMHKLSTRLVRENQVIVVEDLNIKGMLKNPCLSRVISDAGWRMLLTMLAYKCEWYGRNLVKVDRFFPSSKTCHACGVVVESLPLSVREWTCSSCGVKHDRDVNAARNMLAAGHAVAACGPGVSQRILRGAVQLGLKQETSGAS
jgi:putative transposase